MYETGASPVWIPLRAPGEYHDPETDWDYNGARYYAPDMGQFTALEPMEVVDAWPLPSWRRQRRRATPTSTPSTTLPDGQIQTVATR